MAARFRNDSLASAPPSAIRKPENAMSPLRDDSATIADPSRDRVRLGVVIVAVFALSWLSTIPQIWASWQGAAAVPGWAKLLQIFLVAPGLVALAAAWINGGRRACMDLLRRLFRWRAAWWLYAVVLLGPPALMVGSITIANAFFGTAIAMPSAGDALAAFVPTFLVYLVLNTEELCWRGYVLPRMQWRWNPLAASLLLGVVWTLFHAPYFAMKGGHPGGFTPILFVLTLLPMSILQTRFFNAAAGSVLLPHLFHQSINAWAEAVPALPRFSHTTVPLAISAALLIAAAVVAALWPPAMWHDRGRTMGAANDPQSA
jgi:membrane protease YdiL (CAAX protease family)